MAGKGTAAGARAAGQSKRAQQEGLFQVPEQKKLSAGNTLSGLPSSRTKGSSAAQPADGDRGASAAAASTAAPTAAAVPASGVANAVGATKPEPAAKMPPMLSVKQQQVGGTDCLHWLRQTCSLYKLEVFS